MKSKGFFYNLAGFVLEYFCDSRRILATFAKFCLNSLFATWSYRFTRHPASARSSSPPSPTLVFWRKKFFYKMLPLLPIVIAKSRSVQAMFAKVRSAIYVDLVVLYWYVSSLQQFYVLWYCHLTLTVYNSKMLLLNMRRDFSSDQKVFKRLVLPVGDNWWFRIYLTESVALSYI